MRRYRYVGPGDIRAAALAGAAGPAHGAGPAGTTGLPASGEPLTYVVDLEGTLRTADRRSEHVACDEPLPANWNVATPP